MTLRPFDRCQPCRGIPTSIDDGDYRTLAEFRHALRQFLAFSEAAAREHGLTPQQHQAILAIRGRTTDEISVGDLAALLLIRHHTAVELVERLVKAGLVVKTASTDDRRRMALTLTPKAEAVLEGLSSTHLAELRRGKPLLHRLLKRLKDI